MRHWISTVAMAAMLPCLSFAFAADAPVPPAVPPAPAAEKAAPTFVLAPYLQNLQPDAVSILFRTSATAQGWIEFGETEAFGAKAEGIRDGLKTANTTVFAIALRDLKPGTRYFYQVKCREILNYQPYKVTFGEAFASPVLSFTTPKADEKAIKAVIFNDLHNVPVPLATLLKLPQAATFDLAVFNGDCLADLASPKAATPILSTYLNLVSAGSRPAVFVRGNHEIRGGFAREMRTFFASPNGEFYFAFTRGDVRFVMLDCGEDKLDSHPAYSGLNDFEPYRQEVAKWLAAEVASPGFKAARWHVLIHHIPLYGKQISTFSAALYNPIIEKAPFDLAINGHTHRVNLVPAGQGGNRFPALIGGGPVKEATMTIVEATPQRLSAQILDLTGNSLQQWSSETPASTAK
jgi:3',5'-cyclic AMP phosphodiesterase CpdA